MATSGTYSFSAPGDDLLVEAWQRLGFSPSILTAEHAVAARRSLQYLLIDWANRGFKLWMIAPITITTTPSNSQITLPSWVMDVMDIYITVYGTDLIMAPIGRTDYVALSNKKTPGRPTQLWVDRQRDAIVLNLYPTPDQAYSMTLHVLRQPQDVSAIGQTADTPVMWADALAAGLAARLARKYKPDLVQDLTAEAAQAYANANGESRERVPLSILPEWWR